MSLGISIEINASDQLNIQVSSSVLEFVLPLVFLVLLFCEQTTGPTCCVQTSLNSQLFHILGRCPPPAPSSFVNPFLDPTPPLVVCPLIPVMVQNKSRTLLYATYFPGRGKKRKRCFLLSVTKDCHCADAASTWIVKDLICVWKSK